VVDDGWCKDSNLWRFWKRGGGKEGEVNCSKRGILCSILSLGHSLNTYYTLTSCVSTEHSYADCSKIGAPAVSGQRASVVPGILRPYVCYPQTFMCHIDPGAGDDSPTILAPSNAGLRIATVHRAKDKPSRVFCYILLSGDIQEPGVSCMGETERNE